MGANNDTWNYTINNSIQNYYLKLLNDNDNNNKIINNNEILFQMARTIDNSSNYDEIKSKLLYKIINNSLNSKFLSIPIDIWQKINGDLELYDWFHCINTPNNLLNHLQNKIIDFESAS